MVRPSARLPRRLVRALRGRGDGHRRRVRARASPRCCNCCAAQVEASAGRVLYRMRDGVTRDLASSARPSAAFWRGPIGATSIRTPTHGPAHGGVGRRQCRRAADGGRLAPLRPHSRHRGELARPRRDRSGAHRRHARGPIPAACGSACRSRATSSPSRGLSSWTSRPAASTSRCRRGCSICCAAWSPISSCLRSIVTHDLAVARLLSHRIMVMKGGEVIESGLTDQVLDDPREPYTQLLVASILPP